jgi:taurine-pyruvate aminotransferase
MFGFEHYEVAPDIVTMAKGMASAYAPISATAVRSEIFDEFLNDPSDQSDYFRDISTYGGCTGGFAAALENMRIVEDEDLVENARVVGEYLLDRLRELSDHPNVGEVRGKGLFAGLELVADKASKAPVGEDVMAAVMRGITAEGVLAGRTNRSIPGLNNTVNIAPPLIVTNADVDEIVAAVQVGIEKGCRDGLG